MCSVSIGIDKKRFVAILCEYYPKYENSDWKFGREALFEEEKIIYFQFNEIKMIVSALIF